MSYRGSITKQPVATCLRRAIRELEARSLHYGEGTDGRVRVDALKSALYVLYPTARRSDAQWRSRGGFTASFRFFAKLGLILIAVLFLHCASPTDIDAFTGPEPEIPNYEKARRVTVDAWENEFGRLTNHCYEMSKDVVFDIIDYDALQGLCGQSGQKVSACHKYRIQNGEVAESYFYFPDTATVFTIEDSAVHEFIHFLNLCEGTYTDNGHTCYQCWIENSGTESIEAIALSNL